MVRNLASLISTALNPLLMPTILFIILFYFTAFMGNTMSNQQMLYVLATIFVTTFLLPLSCIFILKATNNINSVKIMERRERIMPYIFISLFYLITTYLFFTKIKMNTIFFVVLAAITFILVLLTLITFFWKISTQSAAVCGMVGFLLAVSYKYPQDSLLFILILFILLAGFIMSAKLYLNEHDHKEIYWGGALGFILSFSSIYFFT